MINRRFNYEKINEIGEDIFVKNDTKNLAVLFDWMEEKGYMGDDRIVSTEELLLDRQMLNQEMDKVSEVAPTFFNLLMNIFCTY